MRINIGIPRVKNQELFWKIALILLIAYFIWITLFTSFPYMQDFQEWIYQAWILDKFLSSDLEVRQLYEIKNYAVPNAGFFLLTFVLFYKLLGLYAAAKLMIILYVLTFTLILIRLARLSIPEISLQLSIIGVGIVVFANTFFNGFISYHLSLLFFFYFVLKYQPNFSLLSISLILVITFFTHFIGFILTVGVILFSVFIRKFQNNHLYALLPATILCLWYSTGRIFSTQLQSTPDAIISDFMEYIQFKGYVLARIGPFKSFITQEGTNIWEKFSIVYYSGFIGNFVFAILMLILVFSAFRKLKIAGDLKKLSLGLSLVIAAMGAHLILPYNFAGLFNIGERLLIPSLILWVFFSKWKIWQINTLAISVFLFSAITLTGYHLCLDTYDAKKEKVHLEKIPQGIQLKNYSSLGFPNTSMKYFAHRVFSFDERLELIRNKIYVPIYHHTGILQNKSKKTEGAQIQD